MADFSGFNGKKIMVIGDIMLDKYIYGTVERNCPEDSSAPVLDYKKEKNSLGGCGVAIRNIGNLGGIPMPVCITGEDHESSSIMKFLKEAKAEIGGVIFDKNRHTTSKIRLVSETNGNKILARLDRENREPIKNDIEKTVIDFIKTNIISCDCVVISDYCKGFVTDKIASETIKLTKQFGKPLIVDTKGSIMKYKGATLFTPNEKEAMKFAKELSIDSHTISEIGKGISEKMNSAILVKMGEKGVLLFHNDEEIMFKPSARKVVNVSGAGDVIVATASLMLASGSSMKDAVKAAHVAAGIAISKDVLNVSIDEIEKEMIK